MCAGARFRYARAMRSLVLVIALAACAASKPHTGALAPDDRAAIQDVLDRQVRAWNHGDLPGYMDGYARSPHLVFTSGGDIRLGWQNALVHYQKRYADDPKGMGVLAFTVDSIDPVGPDGAVVLGHWQLTDTLNAGHGVFTLVLARRPEGWRIVHDHTSSSK